MNYPQRKSPRVAGYNYANSGTYFITQCTHQREHFWGNIEAGVMYLNAAGHMITHYWHQLLKRYPTLELDVFVVMPNHFHAIVILTVEDAVSVPTIMQWWKSITTKRYAHGVREHNWMPFAGHVWQRSYHDHIIRNEQSFYTICAYVENNPARWAEDIFYGG
jgi:REP element-mobilizing transposase RayT